MDFSSIAKKLTCTRHPNETISHICTLPDCQASSILFCSKCEKSESSHLSQHKPNIIKIKDFLESQVYQIEPSSVDELLAKTSEIDQKIKKVDDEYKKEDSQIDKDFGALFAIFFKVTETGKTLLKTALREPFNKTGEKSVALRKNLEQMKTTKIDPNELKKAFGQITKDNAEQEMRNLVVKRRQKYNFMQGGIAEITAELETAIKEKPIYKKSMANQGVFDDLKQNFEKTCYSVINLLRGLIEITGTKPIPVKKIDLVPMLNRNNPPSVRDSQNASMAKIAQDIERSRTIFSKNSLNQSQFLSQDISQSSIDLENLSPTKKYQGLSGFPEITNPKVLEVLNKCSTITYPEDVKNDFIDFQTPLTNYKCLELPDVSVYQGQWRNNKRHGLGRIIYLDGGIYEGTWTDDIPSGYGRVIRRNGDMYEGFIRDYKAHGQGTLKTMDGYQYKGTWVEDKKHGEGEEYSENSMFMYRGEFANGAYHGKGVLKREDGRVFDGVFVNGKFTGKGKYFGAASDDLKEQYEGDFVDWKKHGKGVFELADGSRYEGDFVNDLPQGYGEFTWPDGTSFRGLWKQGKQDGMGEEIDANGNKREGEWVEGKWRRWLN